MRMGFWLFGVFAFSGFPSGFVCDFGCFLVLRVVLTFYDCVVEGFWVLFRFYAVWMR